MMMNGGAKTGEQLPKGGKKRTEDELLGRCEHVERERDLILVALALQPRKQIRRIQHGRKERRKNPPPAYVPRRRSSRLFVEFCQEY